MRGETSRIGRSSLHGRRRAAMERLGIPMWGDPWDTRGALPAGLRSEGLFRRSASAQTVREVQRLYNQGESAPAGPSPEPPARPATRPSRASEPGHRGSRTPPSPTPPSPTPQTPASQGWRRLDAILPPGLLRHTRGGRMGAGRGVSIRQRPWPARCGFLSCPCTACRQGDPASAPSPPQRRRHRS